MDDADDADEAGDPDNPNDPDDGCGEVVFMDDRFPFDTVFFGEK